MACVSSPAASYHRPRGIVAAGVEEPNAVVQLEAGPYSVPNARATEIELYQGLAASSVNAEPSLERDRLAINQRLARFLPAGFYYKTFMWPRRLWPRYEARIRAAPAWAARRMPAMPSATTSATPIAMCWCWAADRRDWRPPTRQPRPARA